MTLLDTSISGILSQLKAAGVKISINGGQVELILPKNLPTHLKETLIQHRVEIKTQLLSLASDREKIPNDVVDPSQCVLSSFQQRLWVIDQIKGHSAEYNIPLIFTVEGPFDLSIAEIALNQILKRHSILRTVYFNTADGVRQRVLNDYHLSIEQYDISDLAEREHSAKELQIVQNFIESPFNLNSDLMLKCGFISLATDIEVRGVLMINMHHIASDAWSVEILMREFAKLYDAELFNLTPELPHIPIQYCDFAHWQQQKLSGQSLAQQQEYWERQLADVPLLHSLPLDKERPTIKSTEGSKHALPISSDLVAGIKGLAKQHSMTPFMICHAALAYVMSLHSHCSDIVVGSVVANRQLPELENLVGFFVNTLPLRVNTNQASLGAYLQHIKQVHSEALINQDVPFDKLIEVLKINRSAQFSPLFQVSLSVNSHENSTHNKQALRVSNAELTPYKSERLSTKFDIEISVSLQPEKGTISWVYDHHLFTSENINRLSEHVVACLNSIVKSGDMNGTKLSELTILSNTEQLFLLNSLQEPVIDYPRESCIHEFFELQAKDKAKQTAVVCGSQSMTYEALNSRANRVARYIRDLHIVQADSRIGICLTRSVDVIVAMLAILKAGASYAPLDPSYPKSRLSHLAEDAQLSAILTTNTLLECLPTLESTLILDIHEAHIEAFEDTNLTRAEVGLSSKNLAYVIYTSGSTGKPKGVMISHQALVLSTINHCNLYHDLSAFLLTLSMSFDGSVAGIFSALSSGAKLVLIEEEYRQDPKHIAMLLHREDISHMTQIPSFYELILDHIKEPSVLNLSCVIVAGESSNKKMLDKHLQVFAQRDVQLINEYGPTESTVWCSYKVLNAEEPISIGKPISNSQLLVLNEGALVPFGCEGELYIGGDSLARGYLNLPELTVNKFVDNPYYNAEEVHSAPILYRTGDSVRYLKNGDIQFIGRIDDQAKVRGFRIDLNEIENEINAHDDVESSIVMTDESGLNLYAFFLSSVEEEQKVALVTKIKQSLAQCLPYYMVPNKCLSISRWPLASSGKVDKKVLLDMGNSIGDAEYVEPQTETEIKLGELWASLLNCSAEQISRHAHFFELGGQSLLAVKMCGQIEAIFHVNLSVNQIFSIPVLSELANLLDTTIHNSDNTRFLKATQGNAEVIEELII